MPDWRRVGVSAGSIAGAIVGYVIVKALLGGPVRGALERDGMDETSSAVTAGSPAADAAKQMLKDPTMRRLLDSLTRGMTAAEAQAKGIRLARSGVTRLSEEMLEIRAELLRTMLSRVEVGACAAHARGIPDPFIMAKMTATLSAEEARAWTAMTTEAMIAEVLQSPPRASATQAEIEQAFIEMFDELGDAEADRWATALDSLTQVPNDEACWAGQTLYDRVLKGSPPQRAFRLRILAALDASHLKN